MTPQARDIFNWMQAGNQITQMEALDKFGCFRLSARIFEIRGLIEVERTDKSVVTRRGTRAVIGQFWIKEENLIGGYSERD